MRKASGTKKAKKEHAVNNHSPSMANFTKDPNNIERIILEMNDILQSEDKKMLSPQDCTKAILKFAPQGIKAQAASSIIIFLTGRKNAKIRYLKRIKDKYLPNRTQGYIFTPDAYRIITEHAAPRNTESIFDTLKQYFDTILLETKEELLRVIKEDVADAKQKLEEKYENSYEKIKEMLKALKELMALLKEREDMEASYKNRQREITEKEKVLREKIASFKIF